MSHSVQGGSPKRGTLTCLLSRGSPLFPVLWDPGLQLLPHRLEVCLDKLLKLFSGDAVVVCHGQLSETLQHFIWRADDTGGSVEYPETPPDRGSLCCSHICLLEVEGSGEGKVALPGDAVSDISTNCLSSS